MGNADDFRSDFVAGIVGGAAKKSGDAGGEADPSYLDGGVAFTGSNMMETVQNMEAQKKEAEGCTDPDERFKKRKQFLKNLVATLNNAVGGLPPHIASTIHMAAEAQRRVDKVYIQENPNKVTLPKIFKAQ